MSAPPPRELTRSNRIPAAHSLHQLPALPTLPAEIVAFVLSNLTATEAYQPCLVSKLWRDLGQTVVWRGIEVSAVEALHLESEEWPLGVLFEGEEPRLRLGRKIKELRLRGDRIEPASEEEDQRDDISASYTVLEGYRKLLQTCTRIETLWLDNLPPSMLRPILETVTTSVGDSLKAFKWTCKARGTDSFPPTRTT